MVSPRAPIGKRYRPSEQEKKGVVGAEYVDPFEQFQERRPVSTEGWISWAGSGVLRGLEEASSIVTSRAGYGRGARQQDIPLTVLQGGSSLESDDFNDYDVREEARLVHNALAAFRNAEARGDGKAEITEAEYAAWKRWEYREAELRRIEEERVQRERERELEERRRTTQKITVHLPSRGAPGILVPGQGFVPVGENPAPTSSAPSQYVPIPQPSIPNVPFCLIPGAGRSTSSFHSSTSTIPTRRNVGASFRAADSGSDSDTSTISK